MSNTDGIKYSFFKDRLIVIIAYLIALAGAWLSIGFVAEEALWIKIGVGDFVATVIIFLFSLGLRNSSLYDPYWSVIPIVILVYIFLSINPVTITPRVILVSIVVFYWGIRLTMNWLKTWPGLKHEDWRYKKLAQDMGIFYWPVSFLGIHLFPTIMVFLGCLPLIPIIASDSPLLISDVVGFVISFVAIEIERRSDNQLRAYKQSGVSGGVCDRGLWRYSRHPNYFGEIAFWGGLFVMAYGLNIPGNLAYGSGFLAMVILFVFISIPMMEKRQMRKEGYAEYKKHVWMLVPWFRRR